MDIITIQIDKNLPIAKGLVAEYVELLAKMENGDSFLVESKRITFSSMSKAAQLMGGTITTVKLPAGWVRIHFSI